MCTDPFDQSSPAASPDGSGGALIAWTDSRNRSELDIYATRLLPNGTLDSAWQSNGVAVCTERGGQSAPVMCADSSTGAFVLWLDQRREEADIYAQHLSSSGGLLLQDSDRPFLKPIADVLGDQGGAVTLAWECPLDGPGNSLITGYRVWRRVAITSASTEILTNQEGQALAAEKVVTVSGGLTSYWEALATLPAEQLTYYGYTARTTRDSLPGDNPYSAFFVTALTANPAIFYQSNIDSGYSVDNLAPPAPPGFAVVYRAEGAQLHWTQSRAPDVSHYRLHRGLSASFTPTQDNLVAASPDTGFFDPVPGGQFFYKLAAVDVHGNMSRYALVSPGAPTAALATLVGVESAIGRVSLRWYISTEGAATLTVYRRTVIDGWRPIGRVTPDGSGFVAFEDEDVVAGARYGYRLGVRPEGEPESFAETAWVDLPLSETDLAVSVPNPVISGDVLVTFAAPAGQTVRVTLFDLAGRVVASRDVAGGLGRQSVALAPASSLAPGLYLVRIGRDRPVTARVAVIR